MKTIVISDDTCAKLERIMRALGPATEYDEAIQYAIQVHDVHMEEYE